MPSFTETAIEIAREAGALLLQFHERRTSTGVKTFELKGEQDLLTEADKASEALVVERIRSHFPAHGIVAEEGGGHESKSPYRWYVDPVDGTTNFAHGFPYFNVTLALEHAGQIIAGVVYDPVRDEMFAAERGAGAHLNQRKIRVSNVAKVEEALVATGFPSRKRHQNVNVHFYYQLAMISHGVRRAGAAALDLAYVACGRTDAFWEFTLNAWDMAAGTLLIEEAGGRCGGMRGEPLSLSGEYLFCSNGALHEPMLALFADIFAGRVLYPMVKVESYQPPPA